MFAVKGPPAATLQAQRLVECQLNHRLHSLAFSLALQALTFETGLIQQRHVGVALMPGSTQVLDRRDNTTKPCNPSLCPFADNVAGVLVNRAPYVPTWGFYASISAYAAPALQAITYDFIATMASSQVTQESSFISEYIAACSESSFISAFDAVCPKPCFISAYDAVLSESSFISACIFVLCAAVCSALLLKSRFAACRLFWGQVDVHARAQRQARDDASWDWGVAYAAFGRQ
jgi:hypothetical protein